MKCIAIIPAREGSKRIKNKNIKIFNYKPIISHVIKKLKKSKLFFKIYVSTDSLKIKKIAEKNGAIVPFIRSKSLSNDLSSSRDVINNMINFLEKKNVKFEYICSVYPTSIFITKKILHKAYKILLKNKSKFVFGAIPFSSPIERNFRLNKNGFLKSGMKKKYIKTHTNNLEQSFYDSGQFYFGRKKNFLKKKAIFEKNNIAIKFKTYECVDINNIEDWEFAKILFKYKNQFTF